MAIDFAHALGTSCHIYMISWSECFEICFIDPHIVVILLNNSTTSYAADTWDGYTCSAIWCRQWWIYLLPLRDVSADTLSHKSTVCESNNMFLPLYLVFSFVVSELLIYVLTCRQMGPYARRFTRRGVTRILGPFSALSEDRAGRQATQIVNHLRTSMWRVCVCVVILLNNSTTSYAADAHECVLRQSTGSYHEKSCQ